jgi:hypothetical protein
MSAKLEQIRGLYYSARRGTIQRDLVKAIEILKSMDTDEERQRAAVYMDGLSQMRSEWSARPAYPSPRRRPRSL